MKKLTFLLIPLLLTNLVNSCALVTNDSEIVKQETLRQIEQAKERAEQKLTPQKQMEYARARQIELSKYAESIRIEQEKAQQKAQQERELYEKEQEAKYKRFKEEWVEFIQSGDGSVKNKTTQEVKKLVDQWEDRWKIRMGILRIGEDAIGMIRRRENARKIFLEDFSLENFYKIFGKPWKTQFIENEYFLWYTCKDGHPIITVGAYEYDEGWVNILDLNIL